MLKCVYREEAASSLIKNAAIVICIVGNVGDRFWNAVHWSSVVLQNTSGLNDQMMVRQQNQRCFICFIS